MDNVWTICGIFETRSSVVKGLDTVICHINDDNLFRNKLGLYSLKHLQNIVMEADSNADALTPSYAPMAVL